VLQWGHDFSAVDLHNTKNGFPGRFVPELINPYLKFREMGFVNGFGY